MNHEDDSIKEILKRLEDVNRRLSSIEEFLKGEQEEKFSEEELPEKKEEVTYIIEEEPEKIKTEQKTSISGTPKEKVTTEETPVATADQEKIWFNVLHKIGIFALIIGVGLFIKYSFPYIGLWGRIAGGLFIGVALLYLGEKLMGKYGTYALGISSCGIVILYFSFYAASAFYDLFPPAIAFLLMLLVTVLGVLLSLRYNSSVISFIAIIGAFLTPFVFRGGEITPLALVVLFSYLALINGWILTVTKIKNWKWLNILTFSLTAMMLLTTIKYASESGYPWVFLVFSTVFFALFFYLPRKENAESYVILFLNPFLYYFVLWFVTYEINPYIAGTLALALAAFYYYEGSLSEKKNSLELAWSFISLAVFFLTIAIPIFFKSSWSTCAWAVEGAIILSLGKKEKILKVFSLALLGIAIFKMFFIDYLLFGFFLFFFNSIVVILCVFLSARFLSKGSEGENKGATGALNILGMFLIFWFTLTGTNQFFDKFSHLSDMRSLVTSLLWGIYALALFVVGIVKESSPSRIAGFLMASITILKVFFYDLSYLETTYRILSLVVLGIILLTISFMYHKKFGRVSND
jgi:uncharacterized membrane protein